MLEKNKNNVAHQSIPQNDCHELLGLHVLGSNGVKRTSLLRTKEGRPVFNTETEEIIIKIKAT